MKKLIIILSIVLSITSCKKKEEAQSNAPSIEFISISPTSAAAYEDDVTITINYRDNDGDLGENDADVKNCFVTDSRNGVTYEFRIQQLAPDNSSITIDGNLDIRLDGLGLSDGATSESVTFDVYVIDRAMNQSNTITTTAITVSE